MKRKPNLLLIFVLATLLPAMVALGDDDEVVPGQVVVRFAPGADIPGFLARWRAEYGAEIITRTTSRPIYLLSVFEGDEEEFVDDVEFDPALDWAEPNYFGRDENPDPGTQSIFVASTSGAFQSQPAMKALGVDAAQRFATGRGIVVAAIDSGLDPAHPVLAGKLAPGGWNFITGTPDVADVGDGIDSDGDDLIDESVGHGTMVAGLIARIAPDANILPLKVLDSDGLTNTFLMVEAIFYAIDNGAHIANVSMGTTRQTLVIDAALAEARDAGMLVVASTGNEDDSNPRFPSGSSDESGLGLGVLAVAAVDDDNRRAEFSNYGPHVSLTAPGVDITSTTPGGGYGRANGTSFAAPMVAAGAALYWSGAPDASAGSVRDRLLAFTVDVSAQNPSFDDELGAGRLHVLWPVKGVELRRDQR
ncbi:MAG: S8 family serine peptidase [Phycisphaerales bacterium]